MCKIHKVWSSKKLYLPVVSIPAPSASIAIIVGTIESLPHLTQRNNGDFCTVEYLTPSNKLGQHCVVIVVVHIHLLQRLRHLPESVLAFDHLSGGGHHIGKKYQQLNIF